MSECASPPCFALQSALVPAGAEAQKVADLWWILVGGGALIWLLVMALAWYAVRADPDSHSEMRIRRLIPWGGMVVPALVLLLLLIYALYMMQELRAAGDGLRVAVSGERFWWRVRYVEGDAGENWQRAFIDPPPKQQGAVVDSANEIRLPVGERSEILLYSPDVIHSFWVPSVAGKIDLIPGRVNRLVLEPTRVGTFRGVCAEFCGAGHARMAFDLVVMPRPAFENWLTEQRRPAQVDASDPGHRAFLANGCGACHRVRGTSAHGVVGPDLTHIGSRNHLGAGVLPMGREQLARFIADPARSKPGVQMPAFDMLSQPQIEAIASWLEGLR